MFATLLFSKMGVVTTKVLKVDRLFSLCRTKDNGEEVFRGAEEAGSCKLRLIEAQFDGQEGKAKKSHLILAHCNHQLVLCAEVKQWPISIDPTGEKMEIWLHDYAFVRNEKNPFLFRKFSLQFFTDFAAAEFFKVYTSCLASEGLSYEELQQISSKKMEGVKKRKWEDVDSEDSEDSEDSKDSSSSSDNISIHTQEEEERDNDLFGFDEYAESQNVYAQERIIALPFRKTKRARMMTISDEL